MKNKRLLSLIALLLIAALLLASCGDPDAGKENGESGNPPEGVMPTPLKDAAAKWTEYISYVAPEATPIYTATKIESDENSVINVLRDLIVVVNPEYVYVTPEAEPADPGDGSGDPVEPDPILTENQVITKWYNKFTGALVKTFVDRAPVINAGKVDESIDLTKMFRYDIRYDNGTGLIEVEVLAYTLKEPEPVPEGEDPVEPDLYAVSSYDTVRTYDYYYADGTEFKRGLKEQLSVRDVSNNAAYEAGRYLIDSEELGKTFLMENGEFICEFGYMMEYDLPVYDEDSHNALIRDDYGYITGIGPYAYFEKGGNKYLVTEAMPIMQPIGDLVLYLVPGISISVTDADNKVLANYSAECYGIAGYAVLSNGNIYICEYELLNKDAAEYDIKSGEDKLNVNHKIISITDGKVTSLDKSFKVSKIFNDTTREIRSFINLSTMGIEKFDDNIDDEILLLENVDVDDGYMLAEIQKYADGVLDTNTVFAVLNESLEIVAELPKLVANQFTYPAFVDADTMVVSTRTANNRTVYYGIDTADGEIFILPALNELVRIEPITNGYVWWNYDRSECKVYDVDWKLLEDYTDEDETAESYRSDFRVINNTLYFEYNYEVYVGDDTYEYDTRIKKLDITKSIYEGEDNYAASESDVLDDARFQAGDNAIIHAKNGDIYNLAAQILIDVGEDARYKSVYDENMNDGMGGTLHYYGDVTREYMYTTDTGYVIYTRIDWSLSGAWVETDMPETYTEYEYFVIK